MSVIIGSVEGFMVSDRRVSCNGERFRPVDKVFGNQDLLAGAVGNYLTVRKLKALVCGGARTPDELLEAVDDESGILCVYRGKLYEIDSNGVEQIPEKYFALGSGQHCVLGALHGRDITIDACKEAVKFAGVHRCDVGDGFKVVKA